MVDPKALQVLLARYFEQVKAIVEEHGGTIEKFIGDAVMTVFGVAAAHEDDALRALRAAEEMRIAFPEVPLRCRGGRPDDHGRVRIRAGVLRARRVRRRRWSHTGRCGSRASPTARTRRRTRCS